MGEQSELTPEDRRAAKRKGDLLFVALIFSVLESPVSSETIIKVLGPRRDPSSQRIAGIMHELFAEGWLSRVDDERGPKYAWGPNRLYREFWDEQMPDIPMPRVLETADFSHVIGQLALEDE
ncbi:MAG: hypothetical protein ACTHXC_00600 [Brachybacterium sp.]